VRATPTLQDDDTGKATISLRFDTQVLARIDAGAQRQESAARMAARCGVQSFRIAIASRAPAHMRPAD